MLSAWSGPKNPQKGVPAPMSGGLTLSSSDGSDYVSGTVLVLGTHGGAGETVLAGLLGPFARECHHVWPCSSNEKRSLPVLLTCRTALPDLKAASSVVAQWASGQIRGVLLLGLVMLADQPGTLPKPLRDFAGLVSGGPPHVWNLPYFPELRLGLSPANLKLDRKSQAVIEAIKREFTAKTGYSPIPDLEGK